MFDQIYATYTPKGQKGTNFLIKFLPNFFFIFLHEFNFCKYGNLFLMDKNFWQLIYFSQKLTKFQVTTEKDKFLSLNHTVSLVFSFSIFKGFITTEFVLMPF
jgi:hypothetical protein